MVETTPEFHQAKAPSWHSSAAAMLCFALPALAAFTPYQQLKAARVQDPRSSALVSPLDGLAAGRSLVVVLPQARGPECTQDTPHTPLD